MPIGTLLLYAQSKAVIPALSFAFASAPAFKSVVIILGFWLVNDANLIERG